MGYVAFNCRRALAAKADIRSLVADLESVIKDADHNGD